MLTHDWNLNRVGNLISLHIWSLTSIRSRLFSGNLLQDQTLVGNYDTFVQVMDHLFALKKKKEKDKKWSGYLSRKKKVKGLRAYIVPPCEFIRGGIGINGAWKVDIISFFQILRVHHASKFQGNRGGNYWKQKTPKVNCCSSFWGAKRRGIKLQVHYYLG